jgi:hypothetical protein
MNVTLLWSLASCAKPVDTGEVPPPDTSATTPPEETAAPPIEDLCDGVDDDGDGLVDEDDPDAARDDDGDGVPDCVDPCVLLPAPATTVPIRAACFATPDGRPPPEDPWLFEPKWSWTGLAADPSVRHTVTTPVVADGAVFIVATDGTSGWLVALDGVTGHERWSVGGLAPEAGIVAADLDGDGVSEIVGVLADARVAAWSADGVERWRSTLDAGSRYAQPVVADLDGDGAPEVVVVGGVVTADGDAALTFPPEPAVPYTEPTVADLDGDGAPELMVGTGVFSADGALRWRSDVVGTDGHWWVPVDGGVVLVAEGVLVGYDPDGVELLRVDDASFPGVGPPARTDLDGDLVPDLVWIGGSEVVAWSHDGLPLWDALITDWSGLAGVSAWDADADGVDDVLVADEQAFVVLDGRTGDERFRDEARGSGTVYELPAPADVDGDGFGDVVVPSDGRTSGDGGVTVWSVVDAPAAGPGWSGHAPGAHPGRWRARPAADGQIDLAAPEVVVVESCDEPDGVVKVHVQIGNAGRAAAAVQAAVVDADGGEVRLFDEAVIGPGVVLEGVVVTLAAPYASVSIGSTTPICAE